MRTRTKFPGNNEAAFSEQDKGGKSTKVASSTILPFTSKNRRRGRFGQPPPPVNETRKEGRECPIRQKTSPRLTKSPLTTYRETSVPDRHFWYLCALLTQLTQLASPERSRNRIRFGKGSYSQRTVTPRPPL